MADSRESRDKVPPAAIERIPVGGTAVSLAVGGFVGDPRDEVAVGVADRGLMILNLRQDEQDLLGRIADQPGTNLDIRSRLARTRVSGLRHDDLVVLDEEPGVARILGRGAVSGKSAAGKGWTQLGRISGDEAFGIVLPLRLDMDAFDDLLIFGGGSAAPAVLMRTMAATYTVNATDNTTSGGCDVFADAVNRARIGGAEAGGANVIAYNAGGGLVMQTGANFVLVSANSIHSNTGLGVDLDDNGVTPNDQGDGDTGANDRQNFPVITSVGTGGGQTIIAGSLNSLATTTFTLEFFTNSSCDASRYSKGATYLGATQVTTDSGGNASFNFAFPVAVGLTDQVTGTASKLESSWGNTSEFSACVAASGAGDHIFSDGFESGNTSAWDG